MLFLALHQNNNIDLVVATLSGYVYSTSHHSTIILICGTGSHTTTSLQGSGDSSVCTRLVIYMQHQSNCSICSRMSSSSYTVQASWMSYKGFFKESWLMVSQATMVVCAESMFTTLNRCLLATSNWLVLRLFDSGTTSLDIVSKEAPPFYIEYLYGNFH